MTLSVDVSAQPLSGWGRTTPTTAMVSRPTDTSSIEEVLRTATSGVIARGLGRSYGDAAQCSGGLTIDLGGLDSIGAIDESSGTIEVGGGASLHELMRSIIPSGWFVAVTPGTRYVSVGGAIAADVHGKNHHRDGSFAAPRGRDDDRHAYGYLHRVPRCRPRRCSGPRLAAWA